MLDNSLFIKESNQYVKLELDAVLWIQSDGNYCTIKTKDHKYLVNNSLKSLLEKLPADQFIRTHQRFILNAGQIVSVDLQSNKIITDNKEFPIGRSFRDKFLNRLNIL